MIDLLVRYFHFVGIFIMFAALFGVHLLLRPQIDKQTLKKLVVLDMVYGSFALFVLAMGLTLWLWVGKPSAFYNTNWILHLKVSLFVLVGIISVVPTLFFIKQRELQAELIEVPKRIITIVRIELCILVVIPLLAVLMAHGVGLG